MLAEPFRNKAYYSDVEPLLVNHVDEWYMCPWAIVTIVNI